MIKRVMAAALALSLLGGASALAQPGNDRGNHDEVRGGGGGQPHNNGGAPHPAPAGPAAAPGGGSRAPGGAPHGGPSGFPGGQGGGPRTYSVPGSQGGQRTYGVPGSQGGPRTYSVPGVQGGGPRAYSAPSGQGGGPRTYSAPGPVAHGGYHPGFGAPGFAPGGPRPHYSPQNFPHAFYPRQRYHWRGEWRAPQGFYYRHWGYGDRLPWGWFDQSFWIDDYYDYDLPVPPFGYEWVRVGPDAVLVDQTSGMVVETVYGAFY